jgi:hypothetical protein
MHEIHDKHEMGAGEHCLRYLYLLPQQDAAGRGLLPPRQDRKPIRGAKEARELSIEELGYTLVSHGKAKHVSTRLRGRPVLLEYR